MPLALAPKFDTRTVTGTYLRPDGTPHAGGLVIITYPTLRRVSGVIVEPGPITITLDQAGSFTADLPITDDPDVIGSSHVLLAEPGATHHRPVLIPGGAAPISTANLPQITTIPNDELQIDPSLILELAGRVDAIEDIAVGVVRYDTTQQLTAADRTRASSNILNAGTYTGDLNELIATSMTLVAASATNKPGAGGGILWSVSPYPVLATQFFTDYSGAVHTRIYNNNNNSLWSPWRRGGDVDVDTGWRSLALATEWSGTVLLRRLGETVTLTGDLRGPSVAGNQNPLAAALPSGFRPARQIAAPVSASQTVASPVWAKLRVPTNAGGVALLGSGAVNNIDSDGFTVSWVTNEAWPATLPGTPA